ncbi:hypothetical protein HaLaN_07823 [Haematococcus lacustris]|uniref:Uncharacterized protein n=1 Tax=Haematococcus lacustris TaxID=44745 RepID=A0A699YSD7_HAELA|nr:hypothetical protein HaLaN_07823 [Haematococcus lacustris]
MRHSCSCPVFSAAPPVQPACSTSSSTGRQQGELLPPGSSTLQLQQGQGESGGPLLSAEQSAAAAWLALTAAGHAVAVLWRWCPAPTPAPCTRAPTSPCLP